MRILITGANGFLGQKLVKRFAATAKYSLLCTSASPDRIDARALSYDGQPLSYEFIAADLIDPAAVEAVVRGYNPTHIIHTAAISSVDICEQDPDRCDRTNVQAVGLLANLAKELDAHLTFLSTDFVFDGKNGPYQETDAVAPCNAYGRSKVAAEETLLQSGCRHAILRTILVYGTPNRGSAGKNLVSWAREALIQQQAIRVVSDQWRMPTWVEDLVTACQLAMEKEATGIFHISGDTMMSILEIVQEVADFWHLDKSLITPISAREIGQDNNRPRKTGFYLDKSKDLLGYVPTPFRKSLEHIATELENA